MTDPMQFSVETDPAGRPSRKIVYKARDDDGWDVVEYEEDADGWRQVGHDIANEVTLSV